MMTEGASRHRIAVAVQPPILAELLGRALRDADYDVVVVGGVDGVDSVTVVHYDLAVVSGESDVDADVVIRLPEEGEPSGTARTPDGVEVVDVGDVSSVLEAVRRYR